MASFRTHISFGIAAGILGIIGLAILAVANAPTFLIAVLTLLTLGSILPDMDSDSGVPFHVAFGSLTIVAVVLTFIAIHKQDPSNWKMLIAWSGGVGVFVWGVIGFIFKRFTHHRGMTHSLPSAFLVGLVTFFIASRLNFSDSDAFLLGMAIAVGFVIHLVLDEIWAALNFHGTLFIPNKALGSALKIKSDSVPITIFVYGAIFFLMAGNFNRLSLLAKSLYDSVLGT